MKISKTKLRRGSSIAEKMKRKCSLSKHLRSGPVLISLLGLLCVSVGAASGEHALSEVWSESEGVQMKYSTDHDDLLSSKGSELKLEQAPSGGQPVKADEEESEEAAHPAGHEREAAAESTGAAEANSSNGAEQEEKPGSESAAAADESSSSEGSSAPSSDSENSASEQADSSKQANRVASVTGSGKQIAHYKSDPSTPVYSARGDSRPPKAEQQSYGSALEQVETDEAARENNAEELASVDHGDDSSQSSRDESAGSRFRSPGRHFKEAIKMVSDDSKAPNEVSNGDEDDDDDGEEAAGEARDSSGARKRPLAEAASADEPNNRQSSEEENSSERLSTGAPQLARKIFGSRQNMIEEQRNFAPQRGSFPRPEVSNLDSEEPARGGEEDFRSRNQYPGSALDEEGEFGNQNNRMNGNAGSAFFDQHGRPMAADSSAHPKKRNPPVVAGKQLMAQKESLPTSYKQLSYFKSLGSRLATDSERAPDNSPDSVRDNFISPGHFPGSMPHLNLAAASETQKKEVEPTGSEKEKKETSERVEEKISEPKPVGEPVYATASTNLLEQTSQERSKQQPPVSGADEPLKMVASDTSFRAVSQTDGAMASDTTLKGVQVTPEPDTQPESQQIMAPMLLSTTTMAPMAQTPLATSTTTTTTTTTAAPSLKRFKFRKYR